MTALSKKLDTDSFSKNLWNLNNYSIKYLLIILRNLKVVPRKYQYWLLSNSVSIIEKKTIMRAEEPR